MIATPVAEPATSADDTLVITRRFAVSRDLIWRVWTDPDHLPHWWGPRGFTCRTDEIAVAPGGQWRFDMIAPDGTIYRNRMRYHDVTPKDRIAYTCDDDGIGDHPPFEAAAVFADEAGGTRLTLTMQLGSAEIREAMIRFGAVEGGESTFDCLDEQIADLTDRGPALVLTRIIDAPRDLVWRLWSEAEHLSQWCRPKAFTMVESDGDFRVGGSWRSHSRSPNGDDYRMGGVYTEIDPPTRLSFTHAWRHPDGTLKHETLITVTLADEPGGRTRLTFHQARFESHSARDAHAVGWGEALDHLRAHAAMVLFGDNP